MTSTGIVTTETTYYWPNALKAYELIGNVYTLVKARNYGNTNVELDWILNQKVAELREALKVIVIESSTSITPIEPRIKDPIDPIIPSPPEPILLPDSSTTSSIESTSTLSTTTLPGSTTTTTQPDEITLLALDPNNEEGRLVVDSVDVEAVEVTSGYATYRVVVHLHAEDNAVSNVNVEFQGTELSDSKSVGFLYPDDILVMESAVSGKVYGSGQVAVSGTVKITYTPSSGPTPNNIELASEEREIMASYSKTITLEDGVGPSKVYVSVLTQDENGDGVITAGEDVAFKVVVKNENSNANVAGSCRIDVRYPISSSDTSTRSFSVSVNAPAGVSATETFGSVQYAWSGTFTYTGECSFGQYTKSFSGSVTVEEGDSTDPIVVKMIDVVPISWPSTARLGGSVEFSVDLKNTYPVDKSVKVKLEVDGVVVDVVETTVAAGSSSGVILIWNVPDDFPGGEYTVKIEAWSRNIGSDDPWNPEDSGTDSIEVKGVEIVNINCPQRAGLGETIECKIYLKNTLDERVSINTKKVILTGYPYDEYLHKTRTFSIEYPIQNSTNIDPGHAEVLVVAPIKIPEDKTLLDYRYMYDSTTGTSSFNWEDTNYTLTIQIDMPYPQKDMNIDKPIMLYYFGSPLMKKEGKILEGTFLSGSASVIGASVALLLGLGPIGATIVGGVILVTLVYISVRG